MNFLERDIHNFCQALGIVADRKYPPTAARASGSASISSVAPARGGHLFDMGDGRLRQGRVHASRTASGLAPRPAAA